MFPDQTEAQPLHKSAQRLRWFAGAFEAQRQRTEAETGIRFTLDHDRLTEVFVDWIDAFEAQKPDLPEDNQAYVGFAAGLMLRSLIGLRPVAVAHKPADADDSNPAYFWPEGYLYVAFCLNVRGLVLSKDFASEQQSGAELGETRTWWSFRENVACDPALAIAFLDLFAGAQPEWTMPDLFRSGRAQELAGRFYAKGIGPAD